MLSVARYARSGMCGPKSAVDVAVVFDKSVDVFYCVGAVYSAFLSPQVLNQVHLMFEPTPDGRLESQSAAKSMHLLLSDNRQIPEDIVIS